jgi:hypothetical protein
VSTIRPVEHDDLGQVVSLYERAMRSGRPQAPPGLAGYFERTLLDHPWADAEVPSLVFEDDEGHILGFMGSHVRRLVLDGRPIRMGCGGQLVSDPDQRSQAIGAMLLRRYLAGPQELTITDGATQVVRDMWVRLGGHTLHLASVGWTRLLRPSRAAGDHWLDRGGHDRWQGIARPVLSALDAATTPIMRPSPAPEAVESEELTPQALIGHQEEVFGDARLRVAYDEAYVEWLFREMEAVRTRGRLDRRLLRQDGQLLGWYVVYQQPRGFSQVMQVAATKGSIDTVLDYLLADTWRSGAVALEGRLEPALYESLSRRRCLLRRGTLALYHSRDPEVVAAVSVGESGLTRLDGEWWMGHHTEPFN